MSDIRFSTTVMSHLNQELSLNSKLSRKLQTGKKSTAPENDLGAISSLAKTKSVKNTIKAFQGNFQNAISFLHAQDGAMQTIGKILNRSAELKVRQLSPILNESDKENLNKEFFELQLELRQIREQKFNNISLFSSDTTPALISGAQSINDLVANTSVKPDSLAIKRTGIYDEFIADQSIPFENGADGGGGGSAEQITTINLKNFSGEITLTQWPMNAPDLYTVRHGGTIIYEKMYGSPGNAGNIMTMQNGDQHTVIANTNGGGQTKGFNPGNIDVIEFGKGPDAGNKSMTLEVIVNRGNQPGAGTSWDMGYSIEYDPVVINMTDNESLWELSNFTLENFESFEKTLANARAQNGISTNAFEQIAEHYSRETINLDKFESNLDDEDISKIVQNLKKNESLINLNTKLFKVARDLDDPLVNDFLQIEKFI
jgi:flagellin-like hook-associated protein FlgL